MSAMSNFLENKLVDHIFRGQTFALPATIYVGLFLSDPGEGTPSGEITGNGYARAQLSPTLANWAGTQGAGTTAASSGTGGATSNNSVITFPTPSATWGSVAYFAIFDAASGGNMLIKGPLTGNKTVNQGDTVTFPAGQLQITFD